MPTMETRFSRKEFQRDSVVKVPQQKAKENNVKEVERVNCMRCLRTMRIGGGVQTGVNMITL